jgi:hypothetical protein
MYTSAATRATTTPITTTTTYVATAPTTNPATNIDVLDILDNSTLAAVFNKNKTMITFLFIIIIIV